jgi:hypothetical protein
MPCYDRRCVAMFREEPPWRKIRDLQFVMGEAIGTGFVWQRPSQPVS